MTDFEQHHGMVDMSGVPAAHVRDIHGRALQPSRVAPAAPASRQLAVHGSTSPSPLRTYAEWYLSHSLSGAPLRAVPTVEHFKQESRSAGRKEEAYLWSLMQDIYTDAEHADQYHPEAIGIAAMQPHRRWFVSQYAHLQDFLQRQPVLRRANVVCRWLEATYRDGSRQEPRLQGKEEVVLRQLILTYLRGGELHRAIQAATTYGSCVHSCVLSAAQLQTVPEPWFTQTALVPLFGEYANGELDQAWCGNEHRLDNLAQLYEESLQYRGSRAEGGGGGAPARLSVGASSDFDAVIGAALCGNLEVLDAAFAVDGSWRDMVWCYLRCALVVAFTKQLMTAAGAGDGEAGRPAAGAVDRSYASFIEKMTGSGDDWATTFSQQLVHGLAARLQARHLPTAPLEEQLQMRFILQTLTCMTGSTSAAPAAAAGGMSSGWLPPFASGTAQPLPTEWFDIVPDADSSEAARLITHVVLAQDVAYGETLSPHSVQVRAGAALATSLARYAVFVALLPRYPFDEGLRAVTAMTLRLRDGRHRAGVYAAFIKAARDYEQERRDLTRSQMEEQEARLVRQFVTADGDSGVHAEVQQLLCQQVAPAAMLTHNKLAERVMWEAMHADSLADYTQVLRGGLAACCSFWLMQPTPELEAIADVSSILMRRVLVELQKLTSEECAAPPPPGGFMTELESSEATFWHVLSEARSTAARHATVATELAAARSTADFAGAVVSMGGGVAAASPSSSRTLVYQLTQDEASLLNSLVEQTQRAVVHGGAVVWRDRQCLSAIVWVVKQLTEAVTLSMLSSRPSSSSSSTDAAAAATQESPGQGDEQHRMQHVFQLLEDMHRAGYLLPELLPQQCARELYTQVRAMRVAYGQLVHRRHVAAALRARTARQAEGGGGAFMAVTEFAV